jgi:hypothetical protein
LFGLTALNELPYRPKSGDAPNLSSFGDAVWSAGMRDIETIDSELGLLLAIRHMAREAEVRTPNTAWIDALLDERLTLDLPTWQRDHGWVELNPTVSL